MPLVQEVAEQGNLGNFGAMHLVKEDHDLLDKLDKTRARIKRQISDMANRNFGSIFR